MSKKSWIIPLIVLLAAAGLLFGIAGHWTGWEGSRPDQKTDDAYLKADMTPLSTRISGTVRRVNVGDYQSVKVGQTLIELDDEDYRATLMQAQAALAGSEAALGDNQAVKKIQDAQIDAARAGVIQAQAASNAAKAGITAVSPELDRALTELHRQQALFDAKAATHQQLEAAIVVAEVNLAYTRILAPTNGAVGERHVLAGQLVAPGTQTIDLVQSEVWVQANFKETQLTNMRIGDSADVQIDTFPNRVFHGKVDQLSPASGSQFALLPPDNATGNFTKVVQR